MSNDQNIESSSGNVSTSTTGDSVTTTAHDLGVQRITTADLTSGRSGLLATARHPVTGSPAASLTDSAVIEYEGQQIPLSIAARLGLVQRDAQGNYSEVATADAATKAPTDAPEGDQQQEQQDEDTDGPIPFDADSEAMFSHIAAQVPAELHLGIVESIIEHRGTDGLDMQGAALSGMDAAAYQASIAGISARYQAQSDAWVKQQGIEPASLYAYLWANHPAETKDVMRTIAANRNPKALAPLVSKYLANTSPTTEAMNAGGYETRTERDGTEMVNIPGAGWVSVKVAAKVGLI